MLDKPIRLHPPLLTAIQDGLKAILDKGQPIDKFLLTIARNKRFGSRDRKFVAQHIYDIIRYRRLFDTIYTDHPPGQLGRYPLYVILNIYRCHPDSLPIIVNEEQIMGKDHEHKNAWIELLRNYQSDGADLKISLSFPDWIWELGITEYGEDWINLAQSLNSAPVTYVRVNPIKTSAASLLADLKALGVEGRLMENGHSIELLTRKKLSHDSIYLNGHFEFQDLASQHVAEMSGIQKNMTVIDACAGAGGKSLHIASLMNNTGLLIAADKFPERLKQLEFRAKRSGVTNLEIFSYENLHQWEGRADRVILDVPCTASGTIWRKPEIKWKIDRNQLNQYSGLQETILNNNARLIKPEGKITYATCSIFKQEGEEVVKRFLKQNPEFKIESERRFSPASDRTDGFYIAVLSVC